MSAGINRQKTKGKVMKNVMQETPPLTQMEMSGNDIQLAERAAARMGYTQTAYTSTSGLIGLYCLRDAATDRKPDGCFVKTKQFGLLFVADLEDLQLHDLADEQRQAERDGAL